MMGMVGEGLRVRPAIGMDAILSFQILSFHFFLKMPILYSSIWKCFFLKLQFTYFRLSNAPASKEVSVFCYQ